MSIPLLFAKRGFHPRQLFAALQGAWLEPTPGYIWQENTGVTPTTTGGQTIGKIADLSGWGNNATQATAGNRPTYQLDSNNLPLARHDTTDSLSVSLPSINVRRNLLTYSERFDNAAWVKANAAVTANAALAPDGTATADKVIVSTGGSLGNTYQTPTLSANTFYTYSVYAKKSELNWVALEFRGEISDSRAAWFNLNSGVIGTVQSGLTATITPASNGYYRCSVTGDTKLTAGSTRTRVYPTNSDNTYTTGDGTSGVLVWGAQLELGSTATDYQKITDWTSEAYASSGSVYFATPVGMSALHNQSMGTSYTLPALSTDIYSWIVVPQRLSTAQESRLERYMLRKANLTEPDYLLDDDGNQLMSDDYELLLRQ